MRNKDSQVNPRCSEWHQFLASKCYVKILGTPMFTRQRKGEESLTHFDPAPPIWRCHGCSAKESKYTADILIDQSEQMWFILIFSSIESLQIVCICFQFGKFRLTTTWQHENLDHFNLNQNLESKQNTRQYADTFFTWQFLRARHHRSTQTWFDEQCRGCAGVMWSCEVVVAESANTNLPYIPTHTLDLFMPFFSCWCVISIVQNLKHNFEYHHVLPLKVSVAFQWITPQLLGKMP